MKGHRLNSNMTHAPQGQHTLTRNELTEILLPSGWMVGHRFIPLNAPRKRHAIHMMHVQTNFGIFTKGT